MSPFSSNMQVPRHWVLSRLKHVCKFVGGGTPDKGNTEFWGGEVPWVSPKDMKSFEIVDTEDHLTQAGLDASPARFVEPGAVLIVMRSGILRHSIPVAINRVPVTLNQDMRALIPGPTLESRYLARFIEGHQRHLLAEWSKEGTTVESLDSEIVAESEVWIPPKSEQRAIADYLDRETARLDALLAAKERLLSLLAEKRRALIYRAVTRGLDAGVRFRDSGISRLGEIPAHWDLIPLRFLVEFSGGATPDTGRSEFWEGDIPWVSPKDMKRDEIDDAEDHVTALALSLSPLRIIEPPAVLIVVRGMILAHSFPSAITTRPVTINQDMKALQCRESLEPRFLMDFIRGMEAHLVSRVEESAHGTCKLESEVLGHFDVCVPPIREQRAISSYVASETAKVDALRLATEKTIVLLKERRATLIAAAVTGQCQILEVA